MRSSASAAIVAVFAIASCQGIQERVDVLRAKRIEIIDDDEKTKMDVEVEVRQLRDRVAKLEAQLAKATTAPASQPATSADAGR